MRACLAEVDTVDRHTGIEGGCACARSSPRNSAGFQAAAVPEWLHMPHAHPATRATITAAKIPRMSFILMTQPVRVLDRLHVHNVTDARQTRLLRSQHDFSTILRRATRDRVHMTKNDVGPDAAESARRRGGPSGSWPSARQEREHLREQARAPGPPARTRASPQMRLVTRRWRPCTQPPRR